MIKVMIKAISLLLAVLYVIGLIFIPFMKALRYNIIAWILFGVYILYLIFIFYVLDYRDKRNSVNEEEKQNLLISQELLKDRNKWFM